MFKLVTFLLLLVTIGDIGSTCQISNDIYLIILGDYTSTNQAEVDPNPLPSNPRVNYLNPKTWEWENPNQTLPGLDGIRASPWYYFGQKLSHEMTHSQLYLAVLANDKAKVRDFTSIDDPNSDWSLLDKTIEKFPKNTLVNLLWMVGENDASDLSSQLPRHYQSSDDYTSQLIRLINWSPECYSWGISLTSYSPFHSVSSQNHIRRSQAHVVKKFKNANRVWAGPDTDQICHDDRYHDYYFTVQGTKRLSDNWIKKLQNKTTIIDPDVDYCDYYLLNFDMIVWIVLRMMIISSLIFLFGIMTFLLCQSCNQRRKEQLPKYFYYTEKEPLINT